MSQTSVRTGERTLALLVDGENIPVALAGRIISGAVKHGRITIQRVYGNATRLGAWRDAPGFRPVDSGAGRNAADVLLAIDAVHISHSRAVDTFVLASSDGDFGHLAYHLRERGFDVLGIGEDKAPERFRKACSRFVEIARPVSDNLKPIDRRIHDLIRASEDGSSLRIGVLGQQMGKAGFKISEMEHRNWRRYLESRHDLYRCDDKGPEARVHLLS
ncbi:NYN domain-containing protein [Aestuariicoccus sp. MJ-SS9]|uniref:NYN domain-containing protein n=1 Tax=Aestuariicoccus sp. MJ-SS9 TaxID=3079855 RepID=UPI002915BEA5|nr:NYN domain-containing protein [Aestuariicoccus sp. MJ-SS9]MDU8911782.1 NYN domain-containing protein [Aestuariicoccus sp. MJ-SS9]